jgi:hypothetical protein
MKIDLIDLDQPSTLQTVRIEGLSRSELQAATWRGDDLLVRTQTGEIVVLKAALPRLLDKPCYFVVLDDVPLPLASFAPDLKLPPALSAPHVPPFGVSLPIPVGRSPSGRRGVERTASKGDEAWADQAVALLAATAVDVAQPVPAPVAEPKTASAVSAREAVDDEPLILSAECSPVAVEIAPPETATATTGLVEPVASSGSLSFSAWTWLSWAALGKAAYEMTPKPQAAPAPAPAAAAAATSASATTASATSASPTEAASEGDEAAATSPSTETQSATPVNPAVIDTNTVETALRVLMGGDAGTDASLPAAAPSAPSHAAAAGSSAADLLAASAASMAVIG